MDDWISASEPGVSSADPTPCRARAATSQPMLGARSAQRGRDRKPGDADQKHATATEAITERSAEQDEGGERQQVSVDGPLQAPDRCTEVVADVRQRDVDDRSVEQRH